MTEALAITATILSAVNLLTSTFLLAKHFSTHKIEYLPKAEYEALRRRVESPLQPMVPPEITAEEMAKATKAMNDMLSGVTNFHDGTTGLDS